MDRTTKLSLLRRKADLVAANSGLESMRQFAQKAVHRGLDLAIRFPRMPDSQLLEYDRSLEEMMAHFMIPSEIASVRDPLIKEFGLSRLTVSPKAIVRRVLKRGSIQTEEEYYQINELVSFVDNVEELGAETYRKLDKMAGEFRPKESIVRVARPSARSEEASAVVEVPRWPMVPPEGDNHLCPSGTPLETMERFIRVKLAQLRTYFTNPDDAANFTSMIEGGIRLVYGPHTRPEKRDFQMRYRDHELEAFSGLNVTLEELRSVEAEMQRQFGYRRLLPSPRQLGLNAIEAGQVNEPSVRVIMERTLHDFTAPPVFTPEETRKLKKLLKPQRPSPP